MNLHHVVLLIVALALSTSLAFAQGSTAFNYQGRLLDADEPANGTFNVDFGLWDDPAAGNQVGTANTFNSLPILEGLFTVELDFGASAFDNNDRWLEITVDGVPLVPRQPITRTPYAIQTRGINVDTFGHVGIGVEYPDFALQVDAGNDGIGVFAVTATPGGEGVRGEHNGFSTGTGVYGKSSGAVGIGVFGQATAVDGAGRGVYGQSHGPDGYGVYGLANNSSGTTYGVFGSSFSTSGRGVYGWATASTGSTYGGQFESDSTSGNGVYGWATATSGVTFGGRFVSASTSGNGVYGLATAGTGTTYGVSGTSNSTSGRGVFGNATAASGTTYGGRFESNSTSGFAGYFGGNGNDAVYIENTSDGRGLRAVAPADTAVWAITTTGFAGVHGANAAANGRGVYGQASDTSGTNYGVFGASSSASGFDFYAGGAGTNYGASSSRRWKNNVVPIADPLANLSKLKGVYFDWDEEHGGAHDVGMIAEEVGAVLPEIVQYEENGVDAIGMDYSKMTPLLVEAVNALRAEKDREITSLRAEITSLRAEITSLRAENSDLRAENEELQQRFAKLESLVSRLTTENN